MQRRGFDKDERNNLVLEFLRLVKEFEPKFFVMENVGGLLAPRGKKVMEQNCNKIPFLLEMQHYAQGLQVLFLNSI